MNDQTRKDVGTDRVGLKFEGTDYPEVTAAASESSKEI